jgi:hypothetical protein
MAHVSARRAKRILHNRGPSVPLPKDGCQGQSFKEAQFVVSRIRAVSASRRRAASITAKSWLSFRNTSIRIVCQV